MQNREELLNAKINILQLFTVNGTRDAIKNN